MRKLLDFFRRLGSQRTSSSPGETAESPLYDVDEEGLEFFNSLSGELQVQLSEPAQPIAGLMNLQAPPAARVLSVSLDLQVPNNDGDTRPLAPDELEWVVFQRPTVKLVGEAGLAVEHAAPNGREFSVRDLLRAVEETERQTRGRTEWLGGVDVHHCYFEGIHERDDGVWEITWGS